MVSTERWQYLSEQERADNEILPDAPEYESKNEASMPCNPATEMPGHGKASMEFHQDQGLWETHEVKQMGPGIAR